MLTSEQRTRINAAMQRNRMAYARVMHDNGMLRCPACSDLDKDVYHPQNYCTGCGQSVVDLLKKIADGAR